MKIRKDDVGLGNPKTDPTDLLRAVCFVGALKTSIAVFLYVVLLFITFRFKVPPVVIVCAWGSLVLLGLFGPSFFMRKLHYLGEGAGYNRVYELRRAYVMSIYMATVLGVGCFVTFISSILASSDPDIQPLVWLFLGWVVFTAVPACFWIMRLKTLKKEMENVEDKI